MTRELNEYEVAQVIGMQSMMSSFGTLIVDPDGNIGEVTHGFRVISREVVPVPLWKRIAVEFHEWDGIGVDTYSSTETVDGSAFRRPSYAPTFIADYVDYTYILTVRLGFVSIRWVDFIARGIREHFRNKEYKNGGQE